MKIKLSVDQSELEDYLDALSAKATDPQGGLLAIREQYRQRMSQRYQQIQQTPFSAYSLSLGRIPGTFAVLTGQLRRETIEDYVVQGSQIEFGPSVFYAGRIDEILRKKGPFEDGLQPYTFQDLEQDAETAVDWFLSS